MEGKTLVSKLLLTRQTKKNDPHMNSGGIALRRVQDVVQSVISFPRWRNMLTMQPSKERGSFALRQMPVIVTGKAKLTRHRSNLSVRMQPDTSQQH